MQAILNSNGDEDPVDDIALHAADELTTVKQAAKELPEAWSAVHKWGLKVKPPDGRWAFDLLAPAITKASGTA